MRAMLTEIFTVLMLLSGVGFILIAAIGAVRLPDVLCRSHAVAKASTLGIFAMLLGLWLHLGAEGVGLKILLAMFFQVMTIPVAAHLISLLAWQSGMGRRGQSPPPPDRPSRLSD